MKCKEASDLTFLTTPRAFTGTARDQTLPRAFHGSPERPIYFLLSGEIFPVSILNDSEILPVLIFPDIDINRGTATASETTLRAPAK